MVVHLRLSRCGCRNLPFYRVMAADSRTPRDGKHIEILGYYNPLTGKNGGKRVSVKLDRVKYWLSVGAQPSEAVQSLLARAGLLPPTPVLATGRKGGPRDPRLLVVMPQESQELLVDTDDDDDHEKGSSS